MGGTDQPLVAQALVEPRRLLVVKLADLGDLLTATPALRALRRRFPGAEISALVTPHTAPLLWENDAVDRILTFPKVLFDQVGDLALPGPAGRALIWAARLGWQLRHREWDDVFLLHHLITPGGRLKYRTLLAAIGARRRFGLDNGRGSFLTDRAADRGFGGAHEVDYWLEVVGLAGADLPNPPAEVPNPQMELSSPQMEVPNPQMEVTLTAQEEAWAGQQWRAMGLEGDSVVALHPGSGTFSVARRWPPERFAAVAAALAEDGHRLLVVAGPGEEALARQVGEAMVGTTPIIGPHPNPRPLAALLQRCRLFVGNDSGVMHLAAAVGVPVVAVFGLTNHQAWGPYPPPSHRVVRLDLPCSPCFYRDFALGTPEGCPPRTCLTTLAPGPVIQAARDLLAAQAGPSGSATGWSAGGDTEPGG